MSQGKVQRVTPTYPMQDSTAEIWSDLCEFPFDIHSCGGLLENFSEKMSFH